MAEVLNEYENVVRFLAEGLDRVGSLEADRVLLEGDIGWETRMAIVYRVEKKKILKS